MKKWWAQISQGTKNWWWVVALVTVGLVYFWPYRQTGLPVTHDGENHVARFAQYYLALRQGQFPPRLAPQLENGYGYPVFNYNYPLANILSLPLTALKIDFEVEFKILIVFFVALGAVSWYQWLRVWAIGRRGRWLAAAAFVLSPVLWTGIWYRGNIGEVIIYCLLPLLAWQIERVRAEKKWASVSLAVSLAAYFLAHNVMVLFSAPLMIAYAWWRLYPAKFRHCPINFQLFGKRKIWWGLIIALLAVGTSMWFWLPALLEKNLVALDSSSLNQEYMWHFATPAQLGQLSVTNGLSWPGHVDGLSFGVGLVTWGAWMVTIYLGWRRQTEQFYYPRVSGVLILLVGLGLWCQLDASAWLWARLPLVNFIQFPWRLGWLVAVGGVLLLANLRPTRRAQWWWWSLLALQGLLLLQGRPADFFHHERAHYLDYPMSTTTNRENLPLTFRFDISQEASREPVVWQGAGRVTAVSRLTTTSKSYTVECEDECMVVEHTADFPGLVTSVDGEEVRHVDDDQIRGRVAFIVETGEHQIETRWREKTLPRLAGDFISVLAWCGIGWLAYWESKRGRG